MFNFEDFSRHLLRLWVLALLGLALAARHSHACPIPGRQGDAIPTPVSEEEYADGSTITYECLPGFVRQGGSSVRTCNNGTWSNLTLQCGRKSCGAPPDVLNGHWIYGDILFGATATLKCNTGYKVAGKISTMQCEAGGWNEKGFVCEAVKCPLPKQIPNGSFSPSGDKEYLSYQESVSYTCDKPYTLSGESELRCTENGTYNAKPPECKIVNCSQPEVKFGRQVEGRPPYVDRSFIVYKCFQGYQMKGSSKIVCKDNVWSPKPPVCEKTCPIPGRQGDAIPTSVSEEEYADGSTITYECLPGFVRQGGSFVRTCNNGTWSNLTLQCIRKSCGTPPDVLNGHWIYGDILFGATATLKCNTGYKVAGKISTMQCEAGGWNGKGFVCEAVKCPLPKQIPNGSFSPSGDKEYLSYQESVSYTCDKPYTLSGESELRCTENGTYNAKPPECKIVNCSQPEVKFGRQVEGRPPYVHKSFIVYKCDKGYQMKGSSKIVCKDNVWSPKPPVCEKSDASGTGSLRTEVYSALEKWHYWKHPAHIACPCKLGHCMWYERCTDYSQRVVMALLIPVGLHLSL